MSEIKSHDSAKKAVEAQVIAAMQKQGYTLNAVNTYNENLLHISATNGCDRIVKEILDQKENCRAINRKNKFGWTPLMQAIRGGNIDTVKLLLEKNVNVNDVTYLGMSVLGLAAAISKEMFEMVYDACPDALANAANDDITPLCVAAMKNDKELFFRLLDLGMQLSTINEYTRIMMRCSTVPEIALAEEHSATDDYWNDTSDNIQVTDEHDIGDTVEDRAKPILENDRKRKQELKLNLLSVPLESDKQDSISPNFMDDTFVPLLDSIHFTNIDLTEKSNAHFQEKDINKKTMESDLENYPVKSEYQLKVSPVVLQRLQSVRPPDLDTKNFLYDHDTTLEFTPEFSPLKSPHVPPNVNEEDVFGENTPTPPRCKTPPKGMLLNWQQTKMIMVLKRFGLSQYIPVFLEQEVDLDLFPTLTDEDLTEIGIEYEKDRRYVLQAIEEYKYCKVY